jgi:hypothetical protein
MAREVRVAVIGDASSLKRAMREAETATGKLDDQVQRSTGRMSAAFAGLSGLVAGVAGAAFVGFAKDSWGAAVDTEQAWTRVQGVFGDLSDEIDEFSRKSAKSLGMSRVESLRATGTFGNMLTQLGFVPEEAANMSMAMTTATSDLAAFHKADPSLMIEAMSSAFRNEYDSLQRYIPTISDAAIKQQALAMTGKENADSLTDQEEALAAYKMIMEGMGPAQGAMSDATETQHEKQLKANAAFADAKARLGEMMIPVGTWLMENFSKFIDWWSTEMQPDFEAGIRRMQQLWTEWSADFSTGWDKVQSTWNDWYGDFQAGLSGLGDGFRVLGGYVDWFESRIQNLWDFFNNFKDAVGTTLTGPLQPWKDLLGFDTGGVVPGPIGAPQMAMVHGGETILPTHKTGGQQAMEGRGGAQRNAQAALKARGLSLPEDVQRMQSNDAARTKMAQAIIAHLPGPARQAVLREDHHDLTSLPHADVFARLDALRHHL